MLLGRKRVFSIVLIVVNEMTDVRLGLRQTRKRTGSCRPIGPVLSPAYGDAA